jgi:iron complex outermembrane receptor protein
VRERDAMTNEATIAAAEAAPPSRRRAAGWRAKALLLTASACGSALLTAQPARAQSSELSEIVVTARKRQESILNVPVIETAIPSERLDRLQTTNLKDIATQVPGLVLGTGTATSGLQVSLRGIGNVTNDPAVDQAVSLYIDGLQFSQGMAYAAGMFDTGQVEVLKGPQSLFYGKSSPGGVISVRTNDPTNKAEIIGRVAYEPEARQQRYEMIFSGPVTETLKLRLAGLYGKQDGFYYNNATGIPQLGGLTPRYERLNPQWEYIVRGTALWNPTSNFDARLKLNSYQNRTVHGGVAQYTSCPEGTAPSSGIPFIVGDDCKLNRTMGSVDVDPNFFRGAWYNGVPQQKTRILFGTLEMNWRPTDELTLTSTTGYYRQHTRSMINASTTTAAGPAILVQNGFDRQDFTQELRLNSDYQGPLNFTLGAFFQDGHFRAAQELPVNAILVPAFRTPTLTKGHSNVFINSYSVFGQARWAVTDQLELAAGGRWTDEIRRIKFLNEITGLPVPIPLAVPRIESRRFLPELTATYRPTDTLTIFGSLKKGGKSGNFNAGAIPAPNSDNSYGDEKVKGGELGFKSRLLDRRLAIEVAGYHYDYSDLQVGITENNASGVPVALTVNAGKARVYGVDFSAAYRPESVSGLTLNLNGEWNHGRFRLLNNIPCWSGQLISEGCNQQFSTALNAFQAQDLSDSDLVKAPDWQVNFGFEYEMPVGDDRTLVITNSNNYTSKFLTFPGRRADFYQKGFFKVDLSLALRSNDDRWEVAVIGKNITEKLTGSNCSAYDAVNGSLLTPSPAFGTSTRNAAGMAELACRMDPGREVWLRFTYRPLN